MVETSRHDTWHVGNSYDAYMGRWSRRIAPRFLSWLAAPADRDWLEIGCGTGALSAAILEHGRPKSLISLDSSKGFVATARTNISDERAEFGVGDAQNLALDTASRDVVVSALVLNFLPEREVALAEMKRVARSDGMIGFYVWDYPGGGVEFMHLFWGAAAELDARALELSEDKRFPYCTRDGLIALVSRVGMSSVECTSIEIPTVFRNFDDLWQPFTLGAGPAPGYCANLDPEARQRLRDRLSDNLPRDAGGSITLRARAWAIKAAVA